MTLPALTSSYALDPDTVRAFERDGHCLVRGLASTEEVAAYRDPIVDAALSHAWDKRPLKERDTYGRAFLQAFNLWERGPDLRAFTTSHRFAEVAARLLGVDSVALYHDQALCKEAGGGATPWHQDQHYWPIDSAETVTMWLTLEDIAPEVGTMTFVPGTHRMGNLVDLGISDESEAAYRALIADSEWECVTYGAIAAGDATFHRGWTLHSAGPNPTDRMRPVMTVIYVDASALVAEPVNDAQRLDQKVWFDGRSAGSSVVGPRNPVLFPS